MKFSKETRAAIDAAKKSARILMQYYGKLHEVKHKSSRIDFLTKADVASQNTIINFLRKKFPTHAILAEENSFDSVSLEHNKLWIIDPLDGTKNFFYSLPHFAISIAFQKNGKLISGIIFNPITNELFVAEKDKGAFLNNKKIKASNRKFEDALIGINYGRDRGKVFSAVQRGLIKLTPKIQGFRVYGAASLDNAFVACSRLDACISYSLSPWDCAAALLICKEAQAKVCNEFCKEYKFYDRWFIASNKKIADELIANAEWLHV
ncbi:MAG: inositol monophosphatase [Candidatus Diapherotrites archaeon]|nr:inositol monophosphatase [Candidatus Diapherotrites archaeon]